MSLTQDWKKKVATQPGFEPTTFAIKAESPNHRDTVWRSFPLHVGAFVGYRRDHGVAGAYPITVGWRWGSSWTDHQSASVGIIQSNQLTWEVRFWIGENQRKASHERGEHWKSIKTMFGRQIIYIKIKDKMLSKYRMEEQKIWFKQLWNGICGQQFLWFIGEKRKNKKLLSYCIVFFFFDL